MFVTRFCIVFSAVLASLMLAPPAYAQVSKDQCIDANEAAQLANREGKLTQARAELSLCTHPECPGPVRQDCVELAAQVEAAMPTLVLEARDAQGALVTVVHVTADGQPFAEELNGTPLPLDPGWHRIELTAAGLPRTKASVYLKRAEKSHLERVSLVDRKGPILKAVGIGAASVGALALLFGAYYGLQSRSTYDDARSHCPGGSNACDAEGVRGGQNAHSQASNSTIAFVLGTVLIGGGAGLYVLGTKLTLAPTASPRADSAGLLVQGAW